MNTVVETIRFDKIKKMTKEEWLKYNKSVTGFDLSKYAYCIGHKELEKKMTEDGIKYMTVVRLPKEYTPDTWRRVYDSLEIYKVLQFNEVSLTPSSPWGVYKFSNRVFVFLLSYEEVKDLVKSKLNVLYLEEVRKKVAVLSKREEERKKRSVEVYKQLSKIRSEVIKENPLPPGASIPDNFFVSE